MDTFLYICLGVATLFFCVLVIYLLIVLCDVRKILKNLFSITFELDRRVKNINEIIDKVEEIGDSASSRIINFYKTNIGIIEIIRKIIDLISIFKKEKKNVR